METRVRAKVKELIPTAKYANVEIELEIEAEAEKIVPGEGNIETALNDVYEICDKVLQDKRDPIIEELEGGNS
jgi:hypothetical protein